VGSILGFLSGNKSTGIETTEQLLPIETSLTAVGTLVATAKNKYVLMPHSDGSDYPYVLTTSIQGKS
jgi:hypothetical protein